MIRLATVSVFLMMAVRGVLFAQSLSIGVKGGVRASDDFQDAATSESRRYVVGPSATIALPMGFAIEFDALYRRQVYSTGGGDFVGNSGFSISIREADNVWEFPLLARYRIPLHAIRPFAEVGWAPRITHGAEDVSGCYVNSQLASTCYSSRSHTHWPLMHGVIAGGGLEFATGRALFAPEVRYTHWNQQTVYGYFGDDPSYGSTQDQLDVFLGISWRVAGAETRAAGTGAQFAKSLSLGVKSGVRAMDDFQYPATSESRRYVVGPAATIGLPLGFALEFDALYRRQGYSAAGGNAFYYSSIREADNVWEFPLLARYRIPRRGTRPFIELGWSPRIMHGSQDVNSSYTNAQLHTVYYSQRVPVDWPTTHGVVVGGGLELALGRLRFAPEVRYTRWNRRAIVGDLPLPYGPYGSTLGQLDFFLGIGWRATGPATR